MPESISSDLTDITKLPSNTSARKNLRYGLWVFRKPLNFNHPYIWKETDESYFLPTPFQRDIGIRYYGQRPYRYPDSKGTYTGLVKRTNPKSIQQLLKGMYSKHLPRHRLKIYPDGTRHIAKCTGFALLWAPHLRLRSKNKYVRLIATIRIADSI
ncbi:hypothetical protein ACO0LD_19715 [Undibacterium sp. Ji83W]|uniref:hypothetical protein n=1 Tax=Undibacterium sp. Ji83W TaxID=3413043 RepID=UPI003BF4593E